MNTLPAVPPFHEGVYMGINAVPDVRYVLDSPQGCFFKGEKLALNHDLTSTLMHPLTLHRIASTVVEPEALAFGTESAVRKTVARMVHLTHPSAVFVSEVSAVLLTGGDLKGLCTSLTAELGVPIVHIPPEIFQGDYLDGFDAFLDALAPVLIADAPRRDLDPDAVAIVGYLPDRMEWDHRASIAEMESIVRALGLRSTGVLLGGGSVADLRGVLGAGWIVELPNAGKSARILADATGAQVLPLELPIGLEGTVRFVERLGEATGRVDDARRYADRELHALVPILDRVRTRFLQDRRIAIAADPAQAAGLVEFALEMGMDCPVIGVRSRTEARSGALLRTLERYRVHPLVMHDFAPDNFRRALEDAMSPWPLDVVVGSTTEAVAAHRLGLPLIEVGYPCLLTHALSPRPLLGFAGVRRLAEDLVNAVLRRQFDASFQDEPPAPAPGCGGCPSGGR